MTPGGRGGGGQRRRPRAGRAPPLARHDWQAALDAARAAPVDRRRGGGRPARPGGRGGVVARSARRVHRRRARPPTAPTTSSATTAGPASARCGCGSTTPSTPGRRSPAAGCGGPAGRSTATRSARRTATSCSARPRPPTAPASSTGRSTLATEALDLARRLPSTDLEAEALQTMGRILIDQGQIDEGMGAPRRGDAVRGRGAAGPVRDRQGVLQPHRRLRGRRRLRPRRRVDRGDPALGRAAPVRHLPRRVPRAPRPHPQAQRRRWRRPSGRRPGPATSCGRATCPTAPPRWPRWATSAAASATSSGPRRPSPGSRSSAAGPAAGWRCCASRRGGCRRRWRSPPAAWRQPGQPAGPGRGAPGAGPGGGRGRRPRRRPAGPRRAGRHRRADVHPRAARRRALDPRPAAARRRATRPRWPRCTRRWRRGSALGVPYEEATARTLVGQAQRVAGDEAGAAASFEAAVALFDQIGARLESRLVLDDTQAGAPGRPHRARGRGAAPHRRRA